MVRIHGLRIQLTMINLRFKPQSDGTYRVVGYATVPYSTSNEEQIVETNEDELSAVFDQTDAEDLDGTDESIEAAVENPLVYRDYLILEDGEIVFDDEYEREVDEDTE